MFKKVSLMLVVGAALVLAGCTTSPSPGATDVANKITTTTQTVRDKAAAAQGYATQFCGYLPTLTSVISIFNSGIGSDARTVGDAICNAVTSIPLADGPGDRLPRVNGVVLKGKFVK